MATFLQIAHQVADKTQVPVPLAVFGQPDVFSKRVVHYVDQVCREVHRAHDWTFLRREHTFTAVPGQVQNHMPPDFGRIVGRTVFNATKGWEIRGPLMLREWQNVQHRWRGTRGVNPVYLLSNGQMLIYPEDQISGDTISYWYVTKNWIQGGGSRISADTNEILFDEHLIVAGASARYLADEDQPFALAMKYYNDTLQDLITQDDPLPPDMVPDGAPVSMYDDGGRWSIFRDR